jgi:hypothetical protein
MQNETVLVSDEYNAKKHSLTLVTVILGRVYVAGSSALRPAAYFQVRGAFDPSSTTNITLADIISAWNNRRRLTTLPNYDPNLELHITFYLGPIFDATPTSNSSKHHAAMLTWMQGFVDTPAANRQAYINDESKYTSDNLNFKIELSELFKELTAGFAAHSWMYEAVDYSPDLLRHADPTQWNSAKVALAGAIQVFRVKPADDFASQYTPPVFDAKYKTTIRETALARKVEYERAIAAQQAAQQAPQQAMALQASNTNNQRVRNNNNNNSNNGNQRGGRGPRSSNSNGNRINNGINSNNNNNNGNNGNNGNGSNNNGSYGRRQRTNSNNGGFNNNNNGHVAPPPPQYIPTATQQGHNNGRSSSNNNNNRNRQANPVPPNQRHIMIQHDALHTARMNRAFDTTGTGLVCEACVLNGFDRPFTHSTNNCNRCLRTPPFTKL